MPNFESVLLEYQDRLRGFEASFSEAHTKQAGAVALFAAALSIAVLLCFAAYSARRAVPGWVPAVPLPLMAFALRRFFQARKEASKHWRLCRFYQAGVERRNGEWAGKGNSGSAFCPSNHIYGRDLNLFGPGSMFELLCTVRTQAGQRRLASYLLDLPDKDETIARQEAVKELNSRSGLREGICLLGQHSFQGCEWEPFAEWLASAPVDVGRAVPWILLAISGALTLLVLIPWLAAPGAGLWTVVAPFLLVLAAVQVGLAFMLRARVRPVLERTRRIGDELTILWQGLELMSAQSFHSSKLRCLAGRVSGAAAEVRKLGRLLSAVEQCNKEWFYAISRVLLVDTQLALAIERWRLAHKEDLAAWLDAWSEFETLNALAGYAYEHPADVFPDMVDGAPEFEATALGHPLLPETTCVRNDIHLGQRRKFYLVSGSNMAGKSTFLRAIGINAILGSAGAPVRASYARQSCFAVCASVAIVDSLSEGKSKFMAEVERLRETLRNASGPKPALFVIDEILAGTNSRDRRVAAESFLRALIAAGAIGALSTHDLALTEIVEDESLGGWNVHMESSDSSNPFAFDYLLKAGISTQSNALAIVRMAGVPV